jgi:hypothetical protein
MQEEITVLFNFRIPVELKEALAKRAKEERRDMSGHLIKLIENDVRQSAQTTPAIKQEQA